MSLAAVLAAGRPAASGFDVAIPDTWHQGRTAYGGFSSALALTAARQVAAEVLPGGAPPLRSALVSFVAPLAGEVSVSARLLRSGRNAHWLAGQVEGAAGVGLTASFVFMQPGAGSLALKNRPVPTGLIPVNDAPSVNPVEFTPQFMRHHFDMRFALPRATPRQPDICCWVRPRDGTGLDPMTALLLSADALPPGVLPLLDPAARVSSMTWQINLLTDVPTTQDGWWLLRSTGDYAEHGCSSQQMGIWNTAGEAIASGMQSIAVFD